MKINTPLNAFFYCTHTLNKNQGVQAMAWNTIWAYFDIFRAIKSYLEPFEAITEYENHCHIQY